jgi:hypothetical protein
MTKSLYRRSYVSIMSLMAFAAVLGAPKKW